ncbi:putative secreted protein (Por secretion system target) [Algoriphagus ratkowskyi]|uniref:Putative secreted protein (Por secretion system target) n=1 Tax=Algoriphagus ratkowskyi TaxID=57028 RepID=A0A2W7RE23_9BACT|nr:M43 family zinc metalloprotease [Algoriphagus ratkowskyi]PZX52449.1 putative secreted protein (Por secretion system target) [Algoriphagus ratkowskyi]TXD76204.1 T9SS type A sorting domain-containing protein [Algoriphagus ratkowskyi]
MKKGLRIINKAITLLLGAFFVFSTGFAQQFQTFDITGQLYSANSHSHKEKCGHEILEQKMEKEMGYLGSKPFFEKWINDKIEDITSQPQILARLNAEPILIPVVIHVIHNGNPLGQGVNIPISQIQEQIRVLNEDFQRLNADAANTPAEFLPVAGIANIEFVLAKQDPSGLPTSGITRTSGPKSSYDPNFDASTLGQVIQWDPNIYLNMYVTTLVSPFIGYASFPISDLPGLAGAPTSSLTDGVVIDYRYFGVGGNAVSASKGRTATHEVGHFFGLRHIWGDGGCGVDDFVSDTPLQDNSNNTCSPNVTRFSCDSNDMIQNYMDYTPDACMNLFTKGQVERFEVVLTNSPRRVTLVNNRATQEPVLADNDLAIAKIIEPGDFECDALINPSIILLNAGKNTLTSGTVELRRNGILLQTKRFTFNLKTGESIVVNFTQFTLLPNSNTIEFRITQTNDTTDNVESNNSKTITPKLEQAINLPYTTDLSTFPSPWSISNPDNLITWEKKSLTISGTSQNVVYLQHYEYEAPGQQDYYISPIIDLSKYPNAQLVFEMAYAQYDQAGFSDRLIVAVSQDCGNTFDLANAPYNKIGQQLETTSATLDEFIPTNNNQFRTELVNLAKYASLGSIRLAFISENAYGNDIYLKNIRILPNVEFNYNMRVDEILSPTVIDDGTNEAEIVTLTNTGNLPVSTFLLTRTTNNSFTQTFVASGNSVEPGESFNVSVPKSTSSGKNKLKFKTSSPNFDQNGNNSDSLTRFNIEDASTTAVPWRQNFNNSTTLSPWQTINPELDATAWTIVPITAGEGPNNVAKQKTTSTGQSYWMGTPIFDLSVSRQASIFFDLAAGQVGPSTQLKVLASADGGNEYTEIWTASGSDLSTVSVGEANPNTSADYVRKFVNLSEFAGPGKTKVRLAFVVENGTQSDAPIYLDNIELFLNANPQPVIPAVGMSSLYPNPAREVFNIAFNLPNFEDVTIQVISSTGALVQEIEYPGTLNQTYSFSTQLFSKGVFIINISSNTIRETRRLIIN